MAITGNPGDLATGGFGTGIGGLAATGRDLANAVARGEAMARDRESRGGGLAGGAGRTGGGGTGVMRDYTAGNLLGGLLGGGFQVQPAAAQAAGMGTGFRGPMGTWGSAASVVPGSMLQSQMQNALSSGLLNAAGAYRSGQMNLNQALGAIQPFGGYYDFAPVGLFDTVKGVEKGYLADNPAASSLGEFGTTLGALKSAVDAGLITDPKQVSDINKAVAQGWNPSTGATMIGFQKDPTGYINADILSSAISSSLPSRQAAAQAAPQGRMTAPFGASVLDTQDLSLARAPGYVETGVAPGMQPNAAFNALQAQAVPAAPVNYRGASVINDQDLALGAMPGYVETGVAPGMQPNAAYQQAAPVEPGFLDAVSNFIGGLVPSQAVPAAPEIISNVAPVQKQFYDRIPSDAIVAAAPLAAPSVAEPMYTMDNVPVGLYGTEAPVVSDAIPTGAVPSDYEAALADVNFAPVTGYPGSWPTVTMTPAEPVLPSPEAGILERSLNFLQPANLTPYAAYTGPTPPGQWLEAPTDAGIMAGLIGQPFRYDQGFGYVDGKRVDLPLSMKGFPVLSTADGQARVGGQFLRENSANLGMGDNAGDTREQMRRSRKAGKKGKKAKSETSTADSQSTTSALPQWYIDWYNSQGKTGGILS